MWADLIAKALEAEIVAGKWRPGEELKQGEIAGRFSVSRIPVRDALQMIAARGLIDLMPNRRARVVSLTAAEIEEVYDLRILLECDCLKRAIRNLTPRDLGAIETSLAHSNIDARTDRWAQSDWAFHLSLYQPSQHPRQIAMIEALRRTCRIHIAGYGILPARTNDWLEEHAQLLEACRTGSEHAATSILERHINAARVTLLDAVRARDAVARSENGVR